MISSRTCTVKSLLVEQNLDAWWWSKDYKKGKTVGGALLNWTWLHGRHQTSDWLGNRREEQSELGGKALDQSQGQELEGGAQSARGEGRQQERTIERSPAGLGQDTGPLAGSGTGERSPTKTGTTGARWKLNGIWQKINVVTIGHTIADERRKRSEIGLFSWFWLQAANIKVYQLTVSEMTACLLGHISFACFNVNRMAIIGVRSTNE